MHKLVFCVLCYVYGRIYNTYAVHPIRNRNIRLKSMLWNVSVVWKQAEGNLQSFPATMTNFFVWFHLIQTFFAFHNNNFFNFKLRKSLHLSSFDHLIKLEIFSAMKPLFIFRPCPRSNIQNKNCQIAVNWQFLCLNFGIGTKYRNLVSSQKMYQIIFEMD